MNTKNKPIIGVDIDGVLCDFNGVMQRIFRNSFGVEYSLDQVTTWHYHECLPVTQKQFNSACALFGRQHCEFAPLLPGAAEGMRVLTQDYRIWLITARHDDTLPQTRRWLEHNGIPHDALIFARGKGEFADVVSCMIEDSPRTALHFAKRDVPVVLMDAPYNRGVFADNERHSVDLKLQRNIQRVEFWEDVPRLVRDLIP